MSVAVVRGNQSGVGSTSPSDTSLHTQIIQGMPLAAIKRLIERDTMDRLHHGRTPLQLAVMARRVDVVAELLQCGADPTLRVQVSLKYPGVQGNILHLCAGVDDPNILELILRRLEGDSHLRGLLNQVNEQGVTALSYAVSLRRDACLRVLLEAGVDPNAEFKVQKPGALEHAIASGEERVVRLLLSRHATLYSPASEGLQEHPPLYIAAFRGDRSTMGALLRSGVRADEVSGPKKETAMHAAVRGVAPGAVRYLLLEPGVSTNALDSEGMSLLYRIWKRAQDELAAYSYRTRKMGEQFVPDSAAPGKNYLALCEMFHDVVQAGADLDLVFGPQQATLLYYLSEAGDSTFIDFLVFAGADLDLPAKNGRSALNVLLESRKTTVTAWVKSHERALLQASKLLQQKHQLPNILYALRLLHNHQVLQKQLPFSSQEIPSADALRVELEGVLDAILSSTRASPRGALAIQADQLMRIRDYLERLGMERFSTQFKVLAIEARVPGGMRAKL